MRVFLTGCEQSDSFSSSLLDVGNGDLPTDSDGNISLPCGTIASTRDSLISHVYPDIATNFANDTWLCERSILAPKNDIVQELNRNILSMTDGDSTYYSSFDTVCSDYDGTHFPTEFLNTASSSWFPSSGS